MSEHIWIRAYSRGDSGLHRVGLLTYTWEKPTLFFAVIAKSKKDTFNAMTAKQLAASREWFNCTIALPGETEAQIGQRIHNIIFGDPSFRYLAREYDMITFQPSQQMFKCISDLAHVAHRFTKGL